MPDANGRHPSEGLLVAFDAGELSATDWDDVAVHISSCAECCGRLEQLPADPISARVRLAGSGDALARDGDDLGDVAPVPATPCVAQAGATPGSPAVPAALSGHPRYRVSALLGVGGMGEVFQAEHRLMERPVALKVMRKSLMDRPAAVAQFRREVLAATRLSHPNIVTVHDAEEAGGVHFLVMELVPGASLDRVVAERGPLPVAQACDCMRQAALGLQHAAERNIVHRDIKPQNLMLTPDGIVKILDFGLARFASAACPEVHGDRPPAAGAAVTGTPDYIAPEQAAAPHRADVRADVYSLGCTFYFLLTGRAPFPETRKECAGERSRVPPSLSAHRRDVPPEVVRIVERMLAMDPARRYQNAGDIARDLAALDFGIRGREGPQAVAMRRRTRRRLALTALAGILAVAALVAFALRSSTVDRQSAAQPQPEPPATQPQAAPAEQPVPPAAGPTTNSEPPPAVAPPQVKARLTAWLRENCQFGPEHAMVGQLSDRVARQIDNGGGFELSVGGGLLKSGTPTLLTTWDGELFVLKYSPAQADALGLSTGKIEFRETADRHDPIRATPLLELTDPRLDAADELHPAQKMSGSVNYRWLEEADGSLALRCRCVPGKNGTTRYFYLRAGLPAKQGLIAFTYGPLESAGTPYGGPIPVFFDVVRFTEPNRTDKVVVVSNPVATLINVAAVNGK